MPNGVEFEGRLAHVGTFPIGIEPASFIEVNLPHDLFDYPLTLQLELEKGLSQVAHRSIGAAICWCEAHRWR